MLGLLTVLTLCACREDEAREALIEQGYTEIQLTGPVVFGCDQNDLFRNGFIATSPAGIRIKGTACGGFLKNWTIRTAGRA
ncbi:hypothetical protein [Rhodopila sp.]|uniref:hypothetical protein n=1 Tax=Rhodopila sp. TaxID=2480087 RepID=UPI003D0E1C17